MDNGKLKIMVSASRRFQCRGGHRPPANLPTSIRRAKRMRHPERSVAKSKDLRSIESAKISPLAALGRDDNGRPLAAPTMHHR